MREIINVHIGQTGVKIGEALWELFCLEHGISSDGTLCSEGNSVQHNIAPECNFYTANNKFFPRALFVDSEPDAIDSLRKSPNGRLFNPSFLISGKESAANCYARGRYHVGHEILERALHQIRRMVEACDSFQGFIFHRSICGGTGSGFAAQLFEHLSSEYKRKNRFEVAVFPSPNVSAIPVESYNAVLSTQATLPTIDCSFVLDNEAVYELLKANLKPGDAASDKNLNLLIAQAVSTATLGLRSSGEQTMNMTEFVTTLVPSARLHYTGVSFAPVARSSLGETSMESMTRDLFRNRAHLVSCDFNEGRYVSSCLLYRGPTQPQNVQETIVKIKSLKDVTKAPWCPVTFKLGYVSSPTVYPANCALGGPPEAVSMLTTNTAIKSVFERMTRKFSMMAAHRTFFHHFASEGMSHGDLIEALDDVKDLIDEYQKQEGDTSDDSFSSNTDGI